MKVGDVDGRTLFGKPGICSSTGAMCLRRLDSGVTHVTPGARRRRKKPEYRAGERARAEALGEYIALRAAMDPQVRHFRKVILEGV